MTQLVQNHTKLESSISSSSSPPPPSLSSTSLSDPPTTQPKNTCFNYKSYDHLTKLLPFSSRTRKLTGPGSFHVYPRPWNKLKLWFGSFPPMDDLPLHLPVEFRKKKFTGLQKKEELEREVHVLHKMLAHEQKVHDFLQRLDNRQDGSALTIPNFLPQKMKEILAELAMVENEITRLETHIKQLQDEVKHEKEANIDKKYKQWGRGTQRNHYESPPLPPNPNHINRRPNEKAAFESKALHFINKAIKGDYLSDFSLNEKSMSSREFSSHKENMFRDDGGPVREKVSKKTTLLKAPSPLREPRHPTPRRDRNLDIPADYPSKVLSTPLHTVEESILRWPPNKLSENIMKCLIFIFVRLLRTSRVMELEKSGPIARSTNFSMSFRAETTGSNSKTGLVFQKESRQQDPYGIFDSEESVPRDIGPYKNLVRFSSGSMDLKCIQSSSSVALFQKLKVLMDGLQKVDLRFLSHQQKLAFWINMYNACIMHGYLQYGVPSVFNSENVLALINKATLNIAGNTINAQSIEHFILRKSEESEILGKDKDNREIIVRELYGLGSPDPNITFALCCGTRSSPAVKIYTAEGVTGELERSKLEYLQAAIMVTTSKRVALPELLLNNMNDFAGDKESLMEWVCQQLPTAGSLRKSMVDCFRGGKGSSAIVDKIPYEFEFQYLLAI